MMTQKVLYLSYLRVLIYLRGGIPAGKTLFRFSADLESFQAGLESGREFVLEEFPSLDQYF